MSMIGLRFALGWQLSIAHISSSFLPTWWLGLLQTQTQCFEKMQQTLCCPDHKEPLLLEPALRVSRALFTSFLPSQDRQWQSWKELASVRKRAPPPLPTALMSRAMRFGEESVCSRNCCLISKPSLGLEAVGSSFSDASSEVSKALWQLLTLLYIPLRLHFRSREVLCWTMPGLQPGFVLFLHGGRTWILAEHLLWISVFSCQVRVTITSRVIAKTTWDSV